MSQRFIVVSSTVLDDMEKLLREKNVYDGNPRASVYRACKKGITSARQSVYRNYENAITKAYYIKKKDLKSEKNVTLSGFDSSNGYVAQLRFKDHRIPLYKFDVKRFPKIFRFKFKDKVVKRNGIMLKARQLRSSQLKEFKHSFTATMKSGHTGMFERLDSSSLPIAEIMGSSPSMMLTKDSVLSNIVEPATIAFNESFNDEMEKLL